MNEREKLQQHIDTLFTEAGAPESRAVLELKEELLVNSLEKYADLTAAGMEEEAALTSVAGSIGNVQELVATLPPDTSMLELHQLQTAQRQRSAIIAAIATALYILAGAVLVAGQFFFPWIYGMIGAIVIAIIPTCLLVYSSIAFPKYNKVDDSLVEEFKAFTADAKRRKAVQGAVSVMLWCVILVLYFLLSFGTGAWYITWVLFLVGACIQAAVALVFALKGN